MYPFAYGSAILVLKMKEKTLFKTMFIVGTIFALYGLVVLYALGFLHYFNYFFLIWGIILMLTAYYHKLIVDKLGKKMYDVLRTITYICLSIFLIVEAVIIVYGFSKPKDNASVIIVLGSGVNRNGTLSNDFRARLDSCHEYAKDSDGIIVTTGRKGSNEPEAEAVAGKRYLVSKGISEARIRVDDLSSNTYENIVNADELTKDIEDKRVVIVSSRFHLFRASYIAHKIGLKDVSVKGSIGAYSVLVHSYVREFFALIKDVLVINFAR